MKVKATQSCPTLWDPMDCTVHGILQIGILEWVAIPFSRGSSQPRDRIQVSRIAGRFFTSWATSEAQRIKKQLYFYVLSRNDQKMKCLKMPFILIWKNQTSRNKFKKFHKANVENCQILQVCTIAAAAAAAKSLRSYPILYDPIGSPVPGILQARTLEWVAISSSRGSHRPGDWTHVSSLAAGFFTTSPPGKPAVLINAAL